MHRRQRHLRPSSAGADIYYDSRLQTPQANNTSIATINDFSGNGRNAVNQGVGAPNYIVSSGLAGQPAFDSGGEVIITNFPTYGDQCTMMACYRTGIDRTIAFGGGTVSLQSTMFGVTFLQQNWMDENAQTVFTGTAIQLDSIQIGIRNTRGENETYVETWTFGGPFSTYGSTATQGTLGGPIVPKYFTRFNDNGTPRTSQGTHYYAASWGTNIGKPLARRFAVSMAFSFKMPLVSG